MIQTKPGPTPIDITGQLQVGAVWQPQDESIPSHTVELRRISSSTLVADFFTSRVSLFVYFNGGHMNYEVRASSFGSIVTGLLGNLDGDELNEFVKRGTEEKLQYTYPVHHYLELDLNTCE